MGRQRWHPRIQGHRNHWSRRSQRRLLHTRFFDNAGFHPEYTATVDGAAWKFVEPSTRATLTVWNDGDQIEHVWEWLQDGKWLPLCERTATRR